MRPPDMDGDVAQAWVLKGDVRTPAHYASIYSSLIHAPQAHPLWHWHLLGLISLRDIKGVHPAMKLYPEAEYELGVYAIDPTDKYVPDPDEPGYPLLEPPDVITQFHGIDAEQAKEIGRLATLACTTGHLIPDSDHRSMWKVSVADTVSHFKRGMHGR